ncbi:MAG: BrnT family toxin [Chloroflexota bacterium]
MNFVWDEAKNAANRAKHGIGFEDAISVFEDALITDEDSTKPEHGEIRRKAIGKAGSVIVAVIYTDRPGQRRIISARRARRNERIHYGHREHTG